MPLCYGFTNLSSSEIPEDFEKNFSQCVADVLTKPIERISVIMNCDSRLCKGGSTDPAFILQIHSIGVFDEDRNPEYFTKFFEFLTIALKMPANRMTIQLIDIASYSAKNGQ